MKKVLLKFLQNSKRLRRSILTLFKKETSLQVFSCETFKKTFIEHVRVTTSA